MLKNPKLYEINTRVWLKKFGNPVGKRATLEKIPDEIWDRFLKKGINIVWLMGIWKTCPDMVKKYCFEEFLVRNYDRALKDWKEGDVIGSPYAIDEYSISPELGSPESLFRLKEKLNSLGLKLFLDFVPNHFNAGSSLIHTNPEIFLRVDEEIYKRDTHTFFNPEGTGGYFAHGRDPFFPAWQDTIQVNYFSEQAVEFMTGTLLNIAAFCDGVRCDMAMLPLENVFANTWSGVLSKMGYKKPGRVFWKYAIEKVKAVYPDFTFMAEAYWDLEWELQQLGFDYTYDKRLTDRLIAGNVTEIRAHLEADHFFQMKSVRFIENHDEERAMALLGKHRSQAAAIIISTLKGMKLYYDGQFEGRRIKLPVQLGRDTEEHPVECMVDFYNNLLEITKAEVFTNGDWRLIDTVPAWAENQTNENILAWLWTYGNENRLIIVNYSDIHSQCRIKLDVSGFDDSLRITDLLTNSEYFRSTEEVYHQGLYIDLKGCQCHIFSF